MKAYANLSALKNSTKLTVIIEQLDRLEKAMSALSNKISEVTQATDSAIARVQADVAALNAQIVELETKVANSPTPEDMLALDTLRAKVDALDPVKPITLPN